ncbi:lipopolysaccharide biosynthesis protein [Sphingomonas sp. HT-1]|uniref:lipopolysaccharide biosynthesis protein n=1 Tax=unclassified Sphingomonas TaxID=196159 RepID=UPI0009E817D1|nr:MULTISPECIES: lipopolysaccharide biosynthesis protein [unclassified Sphingomonas]
MLGFLIRLVARLPFLFIAGRAYGPEIVGRYAIVVLVVEFVALVATLGLKRGLAQALSSTSRPHTHVVWDAMMVALVAGLIASFVLILFPQALFPNSAVMGLERFLPLVVIAIALSDVSLSALAYRHNIGASVTARAIVEPWTISIAAWAFSFVSTRDGLLMAYVLSMSAALIASIVPFVREYGLPVGWRPRLAEIWGLARLNAPLAGADAIEWATRNVDRFILGLLFAPSVVGIYYMAQQVASVPQRLKSSFDPILGPVITQSLAAGDRPAVARQVRQVGFWILCAQAGLAVLFSVPAEGVMGLLGREFVIGAGVLCILLFAEVFASPGAVCETALVYIARHTNLMISVGVLLLQIGLSFALIVVARGQGWSVPIQSAAPAVALALALTIGSVAKGLLLQAKLGAPVVTIRPSFFAAIAIAGLVGAAFMSLPHHYEWAEMTFGMPAMVATFLYVIIRFGFGPEDRALFRKVPRAEAVAAEAA